MQTHFKETIEQISSLRQVKIGLASAQAVTKIPVLLGLYEPGKQHRSDPVC